MDYPTAAVGIGSVWGVCMGVASVIKTLYGKN